MDLEKDSQLTSEKLMENGLFSTGIEDKLKIKVQAGKPMAIIQFILLDKILNISISTI